MVELVKDVQAMCDSGEIWTGKKPTPPMTKEAF